MNRPRAYIAPASKPAVPLSPLARPRAIYTAPVPKGSSFHPIRRGQTIVRAVDKSEKSHNENMKREFREAKPKYRLGRALHGAISAIGEAIDSAPVPTLNMFSSGSGMKTHPQTSVRQVRSNTSAKIIAEMSGVPGARRALGGSNSPWDYLDLAAVVPGGKAVGLGAKGAKAGIKATVAGIKHADEAGDAFNRAGKVDAKYIADVNSWVKKTELAAAQVPKSSRTQLLSRKMAEDLALGGDGVWLRFDSEKMMQMPMRGTFSVTRGIPALKHGIKPQTGGVYYVKTVGDRPSGWGGVDDTRIHWIVDTTNDITYVGERGQLHGDILDSLRTHGIDLSYGNTGQGFLNAKDMTDEVWAGTEAGARLIPGAYGGEYKSTAKWLQYLSRNVGFSDDAVDWGRRGGFSRSSFADRLVEAGFSRPRGSGFSRGSSANFFSSLPKRHP